MLISVSYETCGMLRAVKPSKECLNRVRSEALFEGIRWKQILEILASLMSFSVRPENSEAS